MRLRVSAFLLASVLALAACESSEERAERFYQSGMKLLEAGDVDRALVEFRNVFTLNDRHREARLTYARVQRERGNLADAYGQYLSVAEQYPDELAPRIALTEIAIEANDWNEAESHGRRALQLAPEDPAVILVNAVLDYREASLAKDPAAAEAPAEIARKALAAGPGNMIARRLVIDYLVSKGDQTAAMTTIEEGIASNPDQYDLYMMKLRLLAAAEDAPAIGAVLETMSTRFPRNEDVRKLLISYYMQQGDLEAAEAYLRRLAEDPEADQVADITVVEFLRQTKGVEAARTELDRLIAAEPSNSLYRAMRASIEFEEGRTAEAIAQMEEILATATPSDETRNLKVALARMLAATSNQVGARARIEEVLTEDPNHVEALKMQAAWLVDEDKPGEAINALRTALAQAPRDTSVITLMALAHERDGDRDLAGERYALAVEVSDRAPAESLRYATFLLQDDKRDGAEAVLTDALTRNPQDVELLAAMAQIQLQKQDWDRVTRLVWQLRALGTDPATRAANAIESEFLLRQDRVDDTLSFLGSLANDDETGIAVKARMVQIQVQEGRLDEAISFVDAELVKTPDEPTLRFLRAGLYVLQDQPAEAETIYRALFETSPSDQVLQALYGLLGTQNRTQEAEALLDEVMAANPTAVLPRLLRAAQMERDRNFDGAIAIYEALYSENSSNLIVANNLASLVITHRNDSESLERAFAIARRLRGTDVPAFQDTYGWIEYRRGNFDEALTYLEPAAASLPEDPLVQYHLGMTYKELGRIAEARETLTRALEVAGENPLPQFEEARKTLETLGGN